jgi:hypothetical protein
VADATIHSSLPNSLERSFQKHLSDSVVAWLANWSPFMIDARQDDRLTIAKYFEEVR